LSQGLNNCKLAKKANGEDIPLFNGTAYGYKQHPTHGNSAFMKLINQLLKAEAT